MRWKSVITTAFALCAFADALRLTNIDFPTVSDYIPHSVPESQPTPQEVHLEINAVQVVNECAKSDLNDCSPDAVCIDHDNGYECQCSPGYKDTSGDTGLPPGRRCVKTRAEPVNLLPTTPQKILGCTRDAECSVDRKEICSKNACVCPDHLNRDATSGKCESRCTDQPTDLIFLLDGSGSVTEKIFTNDVLPFVQAFTKTFEIGPDKTRVGIIQYSSRLQVEFHLKVHNDRTSLEQAIANITYMGGGTNTGKAIDFMTQYGFTEGNGSRPLSSGVRRVAIVITDGQSYDNVRFPAYEARQRGISLFAVGVTDGVNTDELLDIAGDKSQYTVVQSFKELDLNLRSKIQAQVCTDCEEFVLVLGGLCVNDSALHLASTSPSVPGSCQQNSDCSSDRHEVCDNGICTCPANFFRSVDSGQCDSKCHQQPTDLIFLLDGSLPMAFGFKKDVVPFVLAFTKAFDIGPDKTRVAVMQYSDTVNVEFNLNVFNDRNSLERGISNIQQGTKYWFGYSYTPKQVNTGGAIEFMSRYGFSVGNGSRPLNTGVQRVAIVITNGRSDDSVDGPAQEAKANGILLFGIGITQIASSHQFDEITAYDKSKYILLNAFKDLDVNLKNMVQSEVCAGNSPVPAQTSLSAPAPQPKSHSGGGGVVGSGDSNVGGDGSGAGGGVIGSFVGGGGGGGSGCSSDSVCRKGGEICVSGVCVCPDNVHRNTVSGQCENDPCKTQTNVICGSNSKCVPSANGYACQCNDGYIEVKAAPSKKKKKKSKRKSKKKSKKRSKPQEFICKPGPNIITQKIILGCIRDEECSVDRKEICSKNTCVCPDNLNRDATSGKCESRCTDQATDLIFLLDGSGSVTEEVFKNDVLPFVQAFTKTFEIGPDKTRVGIIQYSDRLQVEFHLNEHNDRTSLEKAIANITYADGGTNTGKAIEFMTQYGFTEGNGSRPLNSGVARVAIVITDGQSWDSVKEPAEEARNRGITVFAVGVTQYVNAFDLEAIAGDASRYTIVHSFKSLDAQLRAKIQNRVCNGSDPGRK